MLVLVLDLKVLWLVPIPTIPLDLYHVCLDQTNRAWVITQISLSFGFGEHLVTLPAAFVPQTGPPIPSPRRRSPCSRCHTSATFQVEAWQD